MRIKNESETEPKRAISQTINNPPSDAAAYRKNVGSVPSNLHAKFFNAEIW